MPYAPLPLILRAAENLQSGGHPLVVVTLSAMLKSAALEASDTNAAAASLQKGIPWGGPDEKGLLDTFFRLPAPPDPAKPFRAVWFSPGKKKAEPWVNKDYPGSTLQRMRTGWYGKGKVFFQRKKDKAAGRDQDEWGLTATPGTDLKSLKCEPVNIVDLALWFGRREQVANIHELLGWFHETFKPNILDLVGTALLDGVPSDYESFAFDDQPVEDAEIATELGGAQQAAMLPSGFDTIVSEIEKRIEKSKFRLLRGMVRRVLTAWLRGDMVVLVGQPGTGKTAFASRLGEAMSNYLQLPPPLVVPVTADFDEAEFIGYQQLDGQPQLRDFAREILDTERPLDAHVVILEEFNLATIESYLATVLIATQEASRQVRLPGGEQRSLPVDAFILATCNSYLDEPETRTRISAPAKRRASIITMPNLLAEEYEAKGGGVIADLAIEQITIERHRIRQRADAGLASMFDQVRADALETVKGPASLSPEVSSALVSVTSAILESPEGRSWFTMGLLRDLALAVAFAERSPDTELRALLDAVADKLVPQLRGPHERATELLKAIDGLPGVEHVNRLLDRMKDGPPEELLPLL
ncbi:AAA family ATPase [Streptomyces sp. cmx-18-6]|uniref:AAA family ATPase n=1 Tax=Streptomyces sp. cmx-18-6 TaxID=2790930 RepID=UPI0039815E71